MISKIALACLLAGFITACAEPQQTQVSKTCTQTIQLIDTPRNQIGRTYSANQAFAIAMKLSQEVSLKRIMLAGSSMSGASFDVKIMTMPILNYMVDQGSVLLSFTASPTDGASGENWVQLPTPVVLDPNLTDHYVAVFTVRQGSPGVTVSDGFFAGSRLFTEGYTNAYAAGSWSSFFTDRGIGAGIEVDGTCATE